MRSQVETRQTVSLPRTARDTDFTDATDQGRHYGEGLGLVKLSASVLQTKTENMPTLNLSLRS